MADSVTGLNMSSGLSRIAIEGVLGEVADWFCPLIARESGLDVSTGSGAEGLGSFVKETGAVSLAMLHILEPDGCAVSTFRGSCCSILSALVLAVCPSFP